MNKTILFVAGFGGPPLDHSLPRIKRHGRLVVLALEGAPQARLDAIARHANALDLVAATDEAALEAAVVAHARRVGADAVMTLDEFSIRAASNAARRLGLAGAGAMIDRARDKFLMREAFARAGVENPCYARVRTLDELRAGLWYTGVPAILKLTEGAGSIGHTVFDADTDVERAWSDLLSFISDLREKGTLGAVDNLAHPEFILESMIEASTESWYDDPTFGDLISVEGLVRGGEYFPIALTSKHRMVPPFTEVGQITPCLLPVEKQLAIVAFARRAVGALGLDACGTHTEIKLQRDGGLCMVEVAARLPGAVITKQVEDAFGVDMIGLLTQTLLGDDVAIPPLQTELKHHASGPLGLVPMSADRRPWTSHPRLRKDIDFSRYLRPDVKYEVTWTGRAAEGDPIPAYDPKLGALNYIGVFYFRAPTIAALVETQLFMMNNAERIFACEDR